MHTNSIIELNNTAYQKPLFSPNHFWKKIQISCVVEMLTATELQKSFQWRTKRDYLLRFDVEENR
jgi:hypothetical protein